MFTALQMRAALVNTIPVAVIGLVVIAGSFFVGGRTGARTP